MNFFYADDANRVLGPIDKEELLALRQGGQIADETPVIEEGAADWHTCADFLSLSSSPPPSPPPPARPVAPPVSHTGRPAPEIKARLPRRLRSLVLQAASLAAVVALAMIVRGHADRSGVRKGREEAAGDRVASRPPIPGTWKLVAYEGKHIVYRFFLPDYWTEMSQPPDENADRAFAGPHGLVLSLYDFDTGAFEAGLRKSMPDARTYTTGSQSFIDSSPVNGVRMVRDMGLAQFGKTLLAVTIRTPVDLPQSIVNAAVFGAGVCLGYSHAAYGKPDRPDAFNAQPRAKSRLLTELDRWDEIDRTTGAVVTQPGTVGKEAYKARMSFYFGWSVGEKFIADAALFQRVMGRPVRTQTMQMGRDATTMWYYECADGTVQLAADARLLANGGQIQATVNDY